MVMVFLSALGAVHRKIAPACAGSSSGQSTVIPCAPSCCSTCVRSFSSRPCASRVFVRLHAPTNASEARTTTTLRLCTRHALSGRGSVDGGPEPSPPRVASATMDLGIDGKVALVTAASKGLGRGTAAALAAEGCRVAICARDPERLAATATELPGEILALPADITEPAAPQRLVDATVERFGRLDILVANAGGPPPARALEVDDAAVDAAVNANLLASIRLVRAGLPHLRAAPWARICCIASWGVKDPITTLALSNI